MPSGAGTGMARPLTPGHRKGREQFMDMTQVTKDLLNLIDMAGIRTDETVTREHGEGGLGVGSWDAIDGYVQSVKAATDLYTCETADWKDAEFLNLIRWYRGHADGTPSEKVLNRAVDDLLAALRPTGGKSADLPESLQWGHFQRHPLFVLQEKWPLTIPQLTAIQKNITRYGGFCRFDVENSKTETILVEVDEDIPGVAVDPDSAQPLIIYAHCVSALVGIKKMRDLVDILTNCLADYIGKIEGLDRPAKDLKQYIETGEIF